ncbi:hypothetical protein KDH_60440 [Dictyobacter sp. S3.2.2.5]|uniref:Uncharacterized protein n=1 Tax=Dictyobacter halimunensis TaxID=3026934 RepID=A0ABQ6G117_9CHLR|nr:hypothetical protein KDH_60440 [Dictyobacter sp. S3.2.2.5]
MSRALPNMGAPDTMGGKGNDVFPFVLVSDSINMIASFTFFSKAPAYAELREHLYLDKIHNVVYIIYMLKEMLEECL